VGESGEGSAGCGVDEEVVGGHVEGLGEADEHVDAGGDALVFVAADALAVGAETLAEFGLGAAVFFAELLMRSPRGISGPSGVSWRADCVPRLMVSYERVRLEMSSLEGGVEVL